jgi:hypothetical protein
MSTGGNIATTPAPAGEIEIHCACGAEHRDATGLDPRGWKAIGNGDAAYVAVCPCGAAHPLAVAREAAVCARCARLVTGLQPDLKVCVSSLGTFYVLCVRCHRKQHEAVVLRPRRH